MPAGACAAPLVAQCWAWLATPELLHAPCRKEGVLNGMAGPNCSINKLRAIQHCAFPNSRAAMFWSPHFTSTCEQIGGPHYTGGGSKRVTGLLCPAQPQQESFVAALPQGIARASTVVQCHPRDISEAGVTCRATPGWWRRWPGRPGRRRRARPKGAGSRRAPATPAARGARRLQPGQRPPCCGLRAVAESLRAARHL